MLKFLFSLSLSAVLVDIRRCTVPLRHDEWNSWSWRSKSIVCPFPCPLPTVRRCIHYSLSWERMSFFCYWCLFFLWKETNKRGLRIRLCLRTVWRVFTNESRDLLFFGALYIDDGAAAAVVQWEKEAGSATSTTSSLPITQPPTHTHTHSLRWLIAPCCTHGPRHRELPSNYSTRKRAPTFASSSSSFGASDVLSQVAYCCCFAMRNMADYMSLLCNNNN